MTRGSVVSILVVVLVIVSAMAYSVQPTVSTHDYTHITLDLERDPSFLPFGLIVTRSHEWVQNDAMIANPMRVFRAAVGSSDSVLVLSATNGEANTGNPAVFTLLNALQWTTIDDDPVYGNITGYSFYDDLSTGMRAVAAGLLRNDTAYFVREIPGTDRMDLLYLSHGEDVNNSGGWDGGPHFCLISDYDFDGTTEVFMYVGPGRDFRPRDLFCVDPKRLQVEWSMPLAGVVGWRTVYPCGDPLNPEIMLVTYNPKNRVEDEYFDDYFCYLARIDRTGKPVYRSIISEQHGGSGLWPAVRSNQFLLFHALPLVSPDSTDSLPAEKYQLSLINERCRLLVTVDVPGPIADVWQADWNSDGRDEHYVLFKSGQLWILGESLNLIAACDETNFVRRITSVALEGTHGPAFVLQTGDGIWLYNTHLEPLAATDLPGTSVDVLRYDSLGNARQLMVSHGVGRSSTLLVSKRGWSAYISVLFWKHRDTIIIILTLLVLALVIVNARRRRISREKTATELRLRSVFENAQDGFYRADQDGRLLWLTPSASQMLGYATTQELIGKPITELYVRPERRSQFLEELEREGRVTDYEVELRHRDGTQVVVSTNSYFFRDDDGRLAGVEGVIRDITGRKAAERALAQSEERYRSLLANLPVGIFRSTPDGRFISVSPGMVAMFGFESEAAMLGADITSLYADAEERDAVMQHLRREGAVTDYEMEMIRRDSSTFWVSGSKHVVYDDIGRVLHLDGVFTDVTERKQAQTALRASEEQYRLLVQNVQAAISLVTYEGTFLFVNEVSAQALGMEAKDVIGSTQWQIFPQPIADGHMASIRNVIDSGKEMRAETIVPLQGKPRNYFTNLQPYRDDSGQITAALVIAYDVTELRSAETQLRRLGHAVEQATDGIAVCDMNGKFEYVNHSWAVMHGMTEDEIVGKHVRIHHTEQQFDEEVMPLWRQVVEQGFHQGEVNHLRADGREFPTHMSVTVMRNQSGQPTGLVATAHDISEAKRAQQALKDSEEQFRSLAEHSLQGIFFIQDERILFANQRFADILHLPLSGIIGQNAMKFLDVMMLDEDQKRERLACYEACMRGEEKVLHQIVRMAVPGAEDRWAEWVSFSFMSRGRIAIQGMVADITEERRAAEKLRASEERYRQLVESAGEAIFTVDREGRFLYVNSITARVAHESAESVVGKLLWQTFPELDTESERERVWRVFDSGNSEVTENSVTVEGTLRTYRTSLQPVQNERGETTAVLGIARDVTETMRMQRELTRERDFVRSLMDTANSLIVCLDSSACITVFNKECERVTGYSREEVLGCSWPDFFLSEEQLSDRPRDFAAWVQTHSHEVYEGPLVTRSGEVRTILWSSTALFPRDGEMTVIAVGQDITERMKAEQALRDSEQFNRAILEKSPLGISVRSRTGKLLSYNDAWRRIWHIWDEDLLDYLHRERTNLEFDQRDAYLSDWMPKVREVYEQGGYLHIPEIDLSLSRKRVQRWLSQHFYAIRGMDGDVDRVVIITEDITQRKLAEAAALAANQEKYEQARSIAGGFAHEIRNALFPAEGALYRMSDLVGDNGDQADRMLQYSRTAVDAVCRAIDITEMISMYTKLESERMPEAVELVRIVAEVVDANKLRCEEQGVAVAVEAPRSAYVTGNYQQLYSVVNNLLLNSLDALTGRDNPSILVTVAQNHDTIRLQFHDNGHGIPNKDLGKVFDAFFSSKPSKGTGLGLAMTKKIVEMYGGAVTIDSEHGHWTQVDVEMSAAEPDATDRPEAGEAGQA